MPTRSYGGRPVDVDAEGFLANPADWTEAMAAAIAQEHGIPALGDLHWKVIQFARKDFGDTGQSPGPRRITAQTGVTTKELYQLFPKGPGKLVAWVAGIPKPKSCL